MNIAVIGRSRINRLLEAELGRAGLTPVFIEQITDINGFEGEKGAFTIDTAQHRISAGQVIITEELGIEKGLTGTPLENTPYISLLGITDIDNLNGHQKPVVILMDFPGEAPAFLTKIGLEKAMKMARRRKNVLYLAKSLRTTGTELETLSREARQSGVLVLKYQEIAIYFQEETNQFQLLVTDDYEKIAVKPDALIVADRVIAGEPLKKLARLFRLKFNESGRCHGNEYFLFPTLTSRQGISVLNNVNGIYEQADLSAHIQYIIAEITSASSNVPNPQHAEVDPRKCAFCYNCFRACPHAAMAPDYENSVMKNLMEACYGCGICFAICPAAAIKITARDDYGHREKTGAKSLRIYACENSGVIAVKEIAGRAPEEFERINVTTMACGGEFSLEDLYKALYNHDQILVLTCMDGACKHFEGNKRAFQLVLKAREQLKAAGLDENRVQYERVSLGMAGVVREMIKEQL